VVKRTTGRAAPLDPRGPRWWSAGWEAFRGRVLATRTGLHLAHVIGTVAEKP
jgi:hypothetical protein